jgi:hypothetical protein
VSTVLIFFHSPLPPTSFPSSDSVLAAALPRPFHAHHEEEFVLVSLRLCIAKEESLMGYI